MGARVVGECYVKPFALFGVPLCSVIEPENFINNIMSIQ